MTEDGRGNLSDLIATYKSETLAQLLHACAVTSICWEDYWEKAICYTSNEAAIAAVWRKFHVR